MKAGDTVLIHSGVYRESVAVTVSGEPGRPITFAAAPQERVVVKGSEIVKGRWIRLGDVRQQQPDFKEPFPHAFRRVWKIRLGDEFFTDARFQGSYADKSRRWVSQVFLDDDHPLQMIGPDRIYTNKDFGQLTIIGQGLADMIPQSFYFDPKDQTLYLCMGGEPGWFCVEVGVRGFALTAENVHDVVIRGLEMRHNWNDNNTLAQWQSRFGQDPHSRLARIEYHRVGTQFRLLTQDGLDVAGPLPEEVTQVWRPQNPKRVGADVTRWPRPAGSQPLPREESR